MVMDIKDELIKRKHLLGMPVTFTHHIGSGVWFGGIGFKPDDPEDTSNWALVREPTMEKAIEKIMWYLGNIPDA